MSKGRSGEQQARSYNNITEWSNVSGDGDKRRPAPTGLGTWCQTRQWGLNSEGFLYYAILVPELVCLDGRWNDREYCTAADIARLADRYEIIEPYMSDRPVAAGTQGVTHRKTDE